MLLGRLSSRAMHAGRRLLREALMLLSFVHDAQGCAPKCAPVRYSIHRALHLRGIATRSSPRILDHPIRPACTLPSIRTR